jgi:hypothetical protein
MDFQKAISCKLKANHGLTLVETILYAAIVTIVVGGFIFILTNMIISADRLSDDLLLAEEKQFIIQKLDNVLQSVSAVNAPAQGASGASLSVNKLNYPANPVTVDLSGGAIRLTRGSGAPVPITSKDITVSDLSFTHTVTTKEVRIRATALLTGPRGTTSIDFTRIIK